jgi:hypothetical protein
MPGIDSVFERTRMAKPKGRSRRRIMQDFQLDEISLVDKPAQEGATAKLLKRATPLHEMQIDYDHAIADVHRLRKRGQHARADQLEQALALHANSSVLKHAGAEVMQTLFDKVRKANGASASAPASASAGSFNYHDDAMSKDDDVEAMLAQLQQQQYPDLDTEELRQLLAEEMDKAEGEDGAEYLEDMGKDEGDDEEEVDPDDMEEMQAADLDNEISLTQAGQNMNDRTQPFTEDTEIGVEANRQMRDKRTSKRRAFTMACARTIAKRGAYDAAFTKASSRITTDSEEPFQQQRATQRRAEMDRRTVATRNRANDELTAMREGVNLGREREERRRMIDGAVTKLRAVDPYMRHTEALRKVRQHYPALFR